MTKPKAKPTQRERLIAALTKRAKITLTAQPEDLIIEGNASAIGEKEDRETEKWIHDQLGAGNEWAWCCAHVRVVFRGFHGDDYLGACSYESEASFRVPGGYFDDMVRAACGRLADLLLDAGEAINDLIGGT